MITSTSLAYFASFSPLRHSPNFVHNESLKSCFVKTCWKKSKPHFFMFSMSVGHSLSFSSLPRITNSGHYESFKNCIYSKLPETVQIICLMMTSISVAYSATFNSVGQKPKYVPNGSLQISFYQTLLGIE